MIKKTTKAIFKDGNYQGEYDWQGGIPLSEGETIIVETTSEKLTYKLVQKETTLTASNADQEVQIDYYFELS